VLPDAARAARDALVDDHALRGAELGAALSDLVDDVVRDALASAARGAAWAVLAMGSYARRELTPGSDVDVMLLHGGGRRAAPTNEEAGALWYPLWDAGFVLGQAVRSVKEALALADDDLDTLTALLDVRLVAGDRGLAAELTRGVRRLAPRRRDRVVDELASAARRRLEQPGPVAEMLEPDLKNGAGGLRDQQAPGWAGWTLPPAGGDGEPEAELLDGRGWAAGVARLVELGYLQADDPARLAAARDRLLDTRIALHRVTGGRSDRLALQDQDAVAKLVGAADADDLVRGVGEAARAVAWITNDVWARMLAAEAGPSGLAGGERDLGRGVVLRDGRVGFGPDAVVDTTTLLHASVAAARARVPFERAALGRLAATAPVAWDDDARDAFVDLLGAGRGAIPVFETLDHVGVLVRLLPEWASVRARPQRNAYHRYTVDRHSLEAVAECAALLDPDDPAGAGFDGDAARSARRDALLLAALLHDIAKGREGDHSVVGEELARTVALRIGVDDGGADDVGWAVRHHLLLAETATRRDLGDDRTISRFADRVGDPGRNALLYALTIGDSHATGPAAWNGSKAALVRELYVKADAWLRPDDVGVEGPDVVAALAERLGHTTAVEYLDAMPASYARAFPVDELARHHALLLAGDLVVEWRPRGDHRWSCTIVAPDRTGLLATAAGALALVGLDIDAASAHGHPGGAALEVFTGHDRFERLATDEGRVAATATITGALAGALDLDEQLQARARRYRPPAAAGVDRDVRVLVDTDASASATVVEVHAPDDVGLLARVASVFADLDLDVEQAIVSTIGDRVVDVFYLHDVTGERFERRYAVEALRATLLSRLTAAITLERITEMRRATR
jgi:[protein-PII] uridylyltransferase